MKFFNNCCLVLKEVVENKSTLTFATKKVLKKAKINDVKNSVSLCGLYLRNYYLIEQISKEIFSTRELDKTIAIGLTYVNVALKKFDTFENGVENLKKYFAEKGFESIDDKIEAFKEVVDKKRNYEFKTLKRGSFSYFSVRYNIPIWLIKMIHNQYGRDYLIPSIRAISKMPTQYVYRNKFLEIPEELQEQLKNYKEIAQDLYEFVPETSIRKERLVKEFNLLPIQMGSYKILKSLPSLEDGEVTVYSGCRSFDFFLPLAKYGEKNNITVIQKNEKDNFEFLSILKKQNFKNLILRSCNEDSVETYISQKQNAIFFYAKSSNIDAMRKEPEYFLTFDPNTLDSLLEDQRKGLNELSKFVVREGYLVYAVNTFNLKETLIMIKKFLSEHSDFAEVKSEIFFPHEPGNSIFYYSILKLVK